MNKRRVLIIEDEFIIADEIATIVSDAGYDVIGPVASIGGAEAAIDDADPPHFAIVDANLRGVPSAPVARRLRAMGIPFCVCTGYRFDDLKPTFGDVALLQKPIDGRTLVAIMRTALGGTAPTA